MVVTKQQCAGYVLPYSDNKTLLMSEKNIMRNRPVASSIIGGGAHIHIFVFADHKNNRFQKKLIVQNTNI